MLKTIVMIVCIFLLVSAFVFAGAFLFPILKYLLITAYEKGENVVANIEGKQILRLRKTKHEIPNTSYASIQELNESMRKFSVQFVNSLGGTTKK